MIQPVHAIIPPINLIGIHGKAGSGKNTVADYISSTYDSVYGEAFARALKVSAAAAFGIQEAIFHDPIHKELHNDFWNVTHRALLQHYGTELFREAMQSLIPGSDFWIRRLTGTINGDLTDPNTGDYCQYAKGDTLIVTDVRFQNEADWIRDNGGQVIHLERDVRPEIIGITAHRSEAGALTGTHYTIYNNGTKEQLYEEVEAFITQHFPELTKSKESND